jgi:hypothetical protein
VSPRTISAFDLPDHLAAKADPSLIAADERHFAAIQQSLERSIDDLSERLDTARKAPGGTGQQALDRDQEVHRLTARLRLLRRFGLDLCLGRMVGADTDQPGGREPVYVGRLGLTDDAGRRLLVDWRSPAAEPFFGATHGNPMGLASRRRYRWTRGRINDYWDEVFTPELFDGQVALDDQSAFIASLGGSRSARMRDVLATLQSDQDAIIRAGSRGALVVDGGPGTGKTVVALHRAAYLLYSDPHLGHRRGGVLFVGPSRPYLAYVADVLPSLGEEGVQTCTVADLVPEGATAEPERAQEVARLKSSAQMVKAIEPAVRFYEEPPTDGMEVETPYADLWLSPADWADAFDSPAPGTPHNEARDAVWEELLTILADKYEGDDEDDGSVDLVRTSLARNGGLADAFDRAWPIVEATDLVGDLWTVPAYLRLCAPWLDSDEIRMLQREDPRAWTLSDLPLLDAARQRLGDSEASRRRRRHEAAVAAERAQMDRVVDELLQHDEEGMMAQLRQQGIRDALVDEGALPETDLDVLAGPFAHVVVDEAQELTDAEWQMLLLRCPSRSFTVVGDRAQARHGFPEPWQERLERIGLDRVTLASLSINYRTPAEIMAEAEPVIRAVLPDANVPTSVRSTDLPVVHGPVADLDSILDSWLIAHPDGIACVISATGTDLGGLPEISRVHSLTPELSKGLEFDLVVLVDPEAFGDGVEGAVDHYVAMTRATQQTGGAEPRLIGWEPSQRLALNPPGDPQPVAETTRLVPWATKIRKVNLPPDLTEQLALQGGVIARRQALALGIEPHDIRRLLRRREWATVHPGVYVEHTGPMTWIQRAWAAVLYAWPAALAHESALRAADGPGRRASRETIIHVVVSHRRTVTAPAGVRVYRSRSVDSRVLWNLGPPRLRYEEAAIDVALDAPDDLAALEVLAAAIQARHTTARRLLSSLDSRSRVQRRDWFIAVLHDLAEGTCSVLEHEFLVRIERAHGLPRGARQQRATAGLSIVYRDVVYDDALVVELDGRLFHDTAAQRDRDFERDLDAAIGAVETVRLSWGQVHARSCSTAAKLALVLRRHGWTGTPVPCGPGCTATGVSDRRTA